MGRFNPLNPEPETLAWLMLTFDPPEFVKL